LQTANSKQQTGNSREQTADSKELILSLLRSLRQLYGKKMEPVAAANYEKHTGGLVNFLFLLAHLASFLP
jgi:hypothetical protein